MRVRLLSSSTSASIEELGSTSIFGAVSPTSMSNSTVSPLRVDLSKSRRRTLPPSTGISSSPKFCGSTPPGATATSRRLLFLELGPDELLRTQQAEVIPCKSVTWRPRTRTFGCLIIFEAVPHYHEAQRHGVLDGGHHITESL